MSHRPISPHSLVHAAHRYHVRAFCHHRKDFRDFVLGRIEDAVVIKPSKIAEIEYKSSLDWASPEEDREWRQAIRIKYKMNGAEGEHESRFPFGLQNR